MELKFPAVLTLTIEEARIVKRALVVSASRAKSQEEAWRELQMACQIEDHIEDYERLEAECDGPAEHQYFPGGIPGIHE